MENMELNLMDLIKRIILKWRALILTMVAGAIAVTVFGGVRSYQTQQQMAQKAAEQLAAGGPAEGEEWITVPDVVWVDVKHIVIGAVIGAFILCACVGIAYILSKKLRTETEMSDGFSVSVLGTVELEHKKKPILPCVDRWIEAMFRREAVMPIETKYQLIATDIRMAAEKQGLKNVCLVGNCDDEIKQNVLQHINSGSETRFYMEGLAIYGSASLVSMLSADGVVLFEQVDNSSFYDIQKELDYCKRYDIAVLGCVVVK